MLLYHLFITVLYAPHSRAFLLMEISELIKKSHTHKKCFILLNMCARAYHLYSCELLMQSMGAFSFKGMFEIVGLTCFLGFFYPCSISRVKRSCFAE